MKRILLSYLLILLTFTEVMAADYTIQSKVLDKATDGAIEMATVRLLNQKDSSYVTGAATDQFGSFSLNRVKSGKYLIEVKFLGYITKYEPVEVKDRSMIFKNILLEENVQNLSAVQVTGMAAQMIVKVDTMEYNASAFKTAENAVVEDLLKRLPGVEVNNGSITVNGESISRIKVDGKKFFDGDIQMTTKNLTADMVEKIQVIDEKSDMAKLTGFEDDNTERIINITLKKNRRKGIFGNVSGAGGADMDQNYFSPDYDWSQFMENDARYNANTFINFMLGDTQTSLVAGANNTNTSRSGRGMGGWRGASGGITNTQNIGINNNTAFSDDLLAGGDISYNHSHNTNNSESSRDSWLAGDTLTNNSRNSSVSDINNSNFRLEVEWHIDTLNTLIIQPNLSFSRSTSNSWSEYDYYSNGDSTSWGGSQNSSVSDNLNTRLNLIYSHKSGKRAGRTFTTQANGSLGQTTSNSFNYSEKNTPDDQTIVDQMTDNGSDNYSLSLRSSYVEPLWNLKNFVEVSASFNYNNRTSDKYQYDQNASGEYNIIDTEYSNNYFNRSMSEVAELNYRYNDGVVNVMAGMRVQPSQNYSRTTYLNGEDPYEVDQKIVNYSPTMSVRYNFGDRRNFLRMEYRGNTQQPSVTQMQPVKNNENLMHETVGNAELNPSYSQNLRLIMTRFNAVTFASWNVTLFGSFTQNALVSNSIYDATGKQYNQTVNADRIPFNLNGSLMYNTPLITNLLHLNTRTSVNYQERVGYTRRMAAGEVIDINNLARGDKSLTQSYGASENLSLTLTQDIIEIGARGSFSYNHTFNHLSNNIQNTMNWSGSGNVNLHLPYSINIATDLSYSNRQGYANFDQSEVLWNASFDKTIRNKVTLSLSMTDILRQRLNISQNIGDNYISYNKYNTLPSYFLLTVTWKIARFAGGASRDNMMGGYGMPGMEGQRGQSRGQGRGQGSQVGGRGMMGGFPPMGM